MRSGASTLALLTDSEALEALGPAWQDLWGRMPGASPFQSPRWLLPWWRQFGTARPHVVTLHRAGGLAGVLPLYVYQDRLLPIGAGTSDHLDALATDTHDAGQMLAHALQHVAGLDACDLIELPPGAHLLSAETDWISQVQPTETCPHLRLAGSIEASIPPRALRKLRMNRHRAERAGGPSYETADAGNLGGMQAALHRLHQIRWTTQGEAGVFADPKVSAMHVDAAPGLLAAGLLRLCAIHLGGELAAAVLALLSPGRIHFYASGFDSRFSFESPGTLLVGHMLEQAIAEGRTEADFLRGGEAYKYAWGAVDRFNSMRLLRRGPG